MFNEAIIEGTMSIAVMGNIIINDVVYKKNYSFTIYWFSAITGILNISIRLTQMYMRRIKQSKNYKYSKELRPFESLSHKEKMVIFFPKISLANVIEFLKPDKVKKFYSYSHRCQQ